MSDKIDDLSLPNSQPEIQLFWITYFAIYFI